MAPNTITSRPKTSSQPRGSHLGWRKNKKPKKKPRREQDPPPEAQSAITKRKSHVYWVRHWIQIRESNQFYTLLLPEMRNQDEHAYTIITEFYK